MTRKKSRKPGDQHHQCLESVRALLSAIGLNKSEINEAMASSYNCKTKTWHPSIPDYIQPDVRDGTLAAISTIVNPHGQKRKSRSKAQAKNLDKLDSDLSSYFLQKNDDAKIMNGSQSLEEDVHVHSTAEEEEEQCTLHPSLVIR
jgi:hypothetical protein